jgi:hypothetical protein
VQPICDHAAVLASVQKLSHMYTKLSNLQLLLFIQFLFLDIICHPVFISNNVLKTGFCLCPQVKPSQFGPADNTASHHLFSLELILTLHAIMYVGSGFCSDRHK